MSSNDIISQKRIHIYVADRKLYLASGQRADKEYPVAVGKPETPTPTGTYKIINKIVNPGGGLGTRWMGLSIPNGPYGIHGTFQPDSIGRAVSNGCIRLYNQHAEELFSLVRIGTTVIIEVYQSGTNSNPGNLYIIKPGDTLWGIARQFGVSVEDLIVLNNLTDPDNLQVGAQLKIPGR